MSAESRKGKSQFKDYFLVLQVHPQADGAMVDAAYWHLAKRYNEAALSDPRYKRKIEELNEAYAVLGVPDRRDEYMQLRALVLGEDALPTPPPPQQERPPLSVMERQKPRARTNRVAQPEKRQFPSQAAMRSGLAATVVLGLGAATLLAGGSLVEVALLLGIGLFIAAAPLGLSFRPRLRAPKLSMPSVSLPTRRQADADEDEDDQDRDEPPAKVIPIDTARLQESIRSSRKHLREDVPAKAEPAGEDVPEFAKLHSKQRDKTVDHAAAAQKTPIQAKLEEALEQATSASGEEPSVLDERD